ncbi:hypothetical protein Tco_1466410 [Tanacetum coccineum]
MLSRSQSLKEQDYNDDKDQEQFELKLQSNLMDLMEECNKGLTSGRITREQKPYFRYQAINEGFDLGLWNFHNTKMKLLKRKNKDPIEAAREYAISRLNSTIVFWAVVNDEAEFRFCFVNPLGKFDGKAEEGFLVGYSVNSKAFRVFNSETRKDEENMHSSDDKAKDDIVDDDACKKTVQEPASEYDQTLQNVLDKMMDQEKEATEICCCLGKRAHQLIPVELSRVFSTGLEDTVEIRSTGIFGNSQFFLLSDQKSWFLQERRQSTKNSRIAYLLVSFSQHEPTKIISRLDDVESRVEAMQEELLQFKFRRRMFKSDFLIGHSLKRRYIVCQPPETSALVSQLRSLLCDEFEEDNAHRFQMTLHGENEENLRSSWVYMSRRKRTGIFLVRTSMVGGFLKVQLGREIHNMRLCSQFLGSRIYEKRLIEMVKIHTDNNVADLLTKAFDVSRFNFLVASIGKRGRDTKIPQSGGPPIKVGDEAVHKELGDRMERAATTASSFEAEQDSDAQTRFEAASKSPMTHLSQELTHLEVGRTKSEGSEGFHQIIDFLNASHIQYALTENPTIYVSFIKQFWRTATARTSANGEVELTATIDGQVKTITEASLRRHLKLEDNGGVTTLPNSEIFEQLALMGTPSTSQPPNTQPTPDAEEAVPMPHESPPHSVHSLGRDEGSLSLSELTVLCTNLSNKVTSLEAELAQTKQTYGTALTKLIKKVKKLEQTVKSTQARRRIRMVVSDDEERLEDPSKQGRKITEIDQDPSISLVQDEGTSWIQEDIEIQEKISDDTEVVLEEEEPTELMEDQGSGEKGEEEVSIVGAEHSTVILEVSTVAANLVYIRRSAHKRKDKGKAIMQESEPAKKVKKRVQVQMSMDEELAKKVFKEQQAKSMAKQEQERINFKAALELKKLLDEREEVAVEPAQAQKIDWSDPAMLRYHAQLNRPYYVVEVRKNMVMYGIKFNPLHPWILKKKKSSEKKGSRKKSIARKRAGEKKSEESIKRKKIEDDIEKEELKAYLDLVPREEFAMEIESLGTKYPIVDWKTHDLTENFMYYQIIRADGGSKNYQIFSEMLDDFDRQDVMDLHKLVEERYATSRPEGYDLMLWGDLKILFQPDEEVEVWRHQHEYNLIS